MPKQGGLTEETTVSHYKGLAQATITTGYVAV
jgi:hypothetical protein